MARLVIDPVTRVGGHLRVEAEVTRGVVSDAWVSGTMYRGLERIIEGRDPRDAWLLAQRVCGSAGQAHALTSVRAIENALGLAIPRNARLVRNLLLGTQLVVDHAAGFYQLQAFDWVDLAAAQAADPAAASSLAQSQSRWPASASFFKAAQQRLAKVLDPDQPGSLGDGQWGHPAFRLSPETDLVIGAHYLEALDWRRRVMRIPVILGGKSPHPQSYLVGGMSLAPEWGGPTRPATGGHQWGLEAVSPGPLSDESLAEVAALIDDIETFVEQVYVPDVVSVMRRYPEWSQLGGGLGHHLAFGEFPEDDTERPTRLLPRGRVMGGDLSSVVQVHHAGVGESVDHSWYTSGAEDGALTHPWQSQAEPRYAGPRPPYATLAGFERYSWVKAARYEDDPMEVGPLSRLLVALADGPGTAGPALATATAQLGLQPEALLSTLGRTLARAVEAQVVAARLGAWLSDLQDGLATGDLALTDISMWDPGTWPSEAQGWALGEAQGGAVGHWVTIRDRRVEHYEIVDATTWNGSPRDTRGRRGAMEQALLGTPVADPDRPIEVLRTVRSFDPCFACAVQ